MSDSGAVAPVPSRPRVGPDVVYRELVDELGRSVTERDTAVTRTRHRYRAAAQSARHDTETAQQAYLGARETRQAAADAVERTDAEAVRLWRELGAFLGRPARLGPVPEPVAEPRSVPAGVLLREARDLMARARRGELSAAPPLPTAAVMLLSGAVGALALFLVARGVLLVGGTPDPDSESAVVVRGLALMILFVAPVAGVPLSLLWLSWRYRQRAGVGGLALCALGGVVVLTLLAVLLGL